MIPTRNLWPFGIITAFILFISGTAALIVIACSHRTDLVAPDYYEQEIRFQGQIERLDRAKRLAVPVAVSYDAARRRIIITLPPGHARPETSGRVQLYRPSSAGLDRQVNLTLDPAGVQTLDARDLKPGLWKVKVTWTANGEDYSVDEKVIIETERT